MSPPQPITDPKLLLALLMRDGRFAMINGLIQNYSDACARSDNKQAALLRIDIHDNVDILLDMIDGNFKDLRARRQR